MKRSDTAALLETVPLFAGLTSSDLERLALGAEIVEVPGGSLLFEEGSEGDRAYVITEGEVEVVKITGDREVLLARRVAGDVIGEMALLDGAPRMASVRASADSTLVTISKEALDHLVQTSASAARSLFSVLLSRWRQTQAQLRQSERMAQLGTLTAGLAHELNNPAAAVARSANRLGPALEAFRLAMEASKDLSDEHSSSLLELLDQAALAGPPMGAMERADLESAAEQELAKAGVPEAGRIASGISDTGIRDFATIIGEYGADAGPVLQTLVATRRLHSLIRGIEEGASRMAAIVGALKSYSYLDQAPLQTVDIRRGIEDTLLILEHKLRDAEVQLEIDDLPPISAYGSELNQVWTNLLDNAADATAGQPDAAITVRARADSGTIVVEVQDNGKGIPSELLPRIFDAFFTTKPPGSGTGLGLDISYSIVVHRHRGDLTVASEPGRTTFTVVLPISSSRAEGTVTQ